MQNDFYFDILDQKRLEILPLFKDIESDFYLAGGTALALQIGHRDSVDFDFFSLKSFSTDKLFARLGQIFTHHRIIMIQNAENTLTISVDSEIKISFFTYQYPLVKPLVSTDYFRMASLEDIALMKLSAIVSRSLLKDYIDLYYIFQILEPNEILGTLEQKFSNLDLNLVLKSLVYFDDIVEEPIIFKHEKDVDFTTVKNSLSQIVKDYLTPKG